MSLETLKKNIPLFTALVDGEKIEFRLWSDYEWEEFIFDYHTLDLFGRCIDFRLKENEGSIEDD